MRPKSALVTIVAGLTLAAGTSAQVMPRLLLPLADIDRASSLPQANTEAMEPLPGFSSIARYQGLIVHSIAFRSTEKAFQDHRGESIAQKVGQPLERSLIRQSIQSLFATGRFADIQVLAEMVPGNQVDIVFLTSPNYFVGDIRVETDSSHPSSTQIAYASKLQLGELYTPEKMQRALKGIEQVMQENGYYRSTIAHQETDIPENQQVSILFRVRAGALAHVGHVHVAGNPGYSEGQVQDIAKLHPGDRVSEDRVTRALQRVRKKYEKQKRLLADVSVAERTYRPDANLVDYTLQITPGPAVAITAEGFKLGRGVLKKNVPVYEEGALDDDLLAEGRHNLLDYLQTRGYFDAKIGIRKQEESQNQLRVVYVIDPGPRHKLVKVNIEGNTNKGFPTDLLRSHLQIQTASRVFSHGRFSQSLLNGDVRNLEALYHDSGFLQAKVKATVQDNYEGVATQLSVTVQIEEGPQTLVGALHIVGNHSVPADQFPAINTAVGQPFSDSRISEDRDIILNHYFNDGFANASFEATAKPIENQPDRMDVTFKITEGEQFFVNQVVVSGLNHTRPYIVQRELRVKPETPLSQQDMLDSQRRLYDLGIFNQVDTAVQNPDGTETDKNVLVDVREAKRYTIDYGGGIEFQTSQPGVGSTQPQGNTGVSPRVSLAVTRLNFRGRDQTITLRGNLGSLQQRALLSFEAPKWLRPDFRLSLTGFYDNTLDVTTFSSQRLEASIQLEETFSRVSKMFYRFTFRRVKASNIVVAQDEIPLLSQPTRVGMPGFTYIRDKRDNPLETTKGNYTTLDGGVAASVFASEANFGRLLFQNSTYQAFGKNRPEDKKFVFARSTRVGVEAPYGNTVILAPGENVGNPALVPIPLPERFFMGGGNSHRGFGLNQAGPRDPTTGFPLGGSALFLNNLELRFPPLSLPYVQDNVSLAVFHDAGNVFTAGHDLLHSFLNWRQPNPSVCLQQSTADQCSYKYMSQAVGLGVRYKTPIGPVRFDFGYNLTPPAFPSCQQQNSTGSCSFVPQHLTHFNVFVSIGQTF